MTKDVTLYLEQANSFLVSLMFCAASKNLTELRVNKKKYLYTIFCLEIKDNGNFVIFLKIFKPMKRKNKHGNLLNIQENTTQLFENIDEANSYVNSFLSSFQEHERILSNLPDTEDNMPAGNAILIVNNWEQSILEHFNELVKNSLKISSE